MNVNHKLVKLLDKFDTDCLSFMASKHSAIRLLEFCWPRCGEKKNSKVFFQGNYQLGQIRQTRKRSSDKISNNLENSWISIVVPTDLFGPKRSSYVTLIPVFKIMTCYRWNESSNMAFLWCMRFIVFIFSNNHWRKNLNQLG